MTTICRIGDYLYSDSLLTYKVNGEPSNTAFSLKVIFYTGVPICIDGIEIKAIAVAGDMEEALKFIEYVKELALDICHYVKNELSVEINKPVELKDILVTITRLGSMVDYDNLYIFCGSIDNKACYYVVDMGKGSINEFPTNSVIGSGSNSVKLIHQLLGFDEPSLYTLPYVSIFDEYTGEEFYQYDAIKNTIEQLNPRIRLFNKREHSEFIKMGEKLSGAISNKLMSWKN